MTLTIRLAYCRDRLTRFEAGLERARKAYQLTPIPLHARHVSRAAANVSAEWGALAKLLSEQASK